MGATSMSKVTSKTWGHGCEHGGSRGTGWVTPAVVLFVTKLLFCSQLIGR